MPPEIARHQVHGNPRHRRALVYCMTNIAVNSCKRYRHFSRYNQFIEAGTIEHRAP